MKHAKSMAWKEKKREKKLKGVFAGTGKVNEVKNKKFERGVGLRLNTEERYKEKKDKEER